MATQQWRLPASMRMPSRIPLPGEATGSADLLQGLSASVEAHPDFIARAAIWRDQASGLISLAEARRRSHNVGRAAEGHKRRQEATARPRMVRPEPNASRQYSGHMATTAARDDRLTPNAKAFLQVLRARCGKGRSTEITKGTMGAVMARSARTIRRYLGDLERLGYITTEIRCTTRGLHIGLLVTITDKVTPFFEEAKDLARWLAETPAAALRPFKTVYDPVGPRVTILAPKNQPPKKTFQLSRNWLSKEAGTTLEQPG